VIRKSQIILSHKNYINSCLQYPGCLIRFSAMSESRQEVVEVVGNGDREAAQECKHSIG